MRTDDPVVFGTNNLERLRILSGGTLDVSETTAPATPAAGHTYVYHDASDDAFKLMDSAGLITVLN
jgi:hypothetical protein